MPLRSEQVEDKTRWDKRRNRLRTALYELTGHDLEKQAKLRGYWQADRSKDGFDAKRATIMAARSRTAPSSRSVPLVRCWTRSTASSGETWIWTIRRDASDTAVRA